MGAMKMMSKVPKMALDRIEGGLKAREAARVEDNKKLMASMGGGFPSAASLSKKKGR